MWTCPICEKTGTGGRFCTRCGFDLTTDAVSNPTACALPDSAAAALRNARQRWLASNSGYSVKRSEIVDGHTWTGAAAPQPSFDPHAGAYAVPGARIVEGQVRTAESPNQRPEADRRSEYAVPGASVVDGQYRTAAPERDQPAYGTGQPQRGANPPYRQGGQNQKNTGPRFQQAGQNQQGANPQFQQAGQNRRGANPQFRQANQNQRDANAQYRQPGQPQAGGNSQFPQPGQTVRPAQNTKAGRKFWRVFRIILGAFLAFCALVCLIVLLSGEAGSDAVPVFFVMNLFGVGAWLLFRKRKPKQ